MKLDPNAPASIMTKREKIATDLLPGILNMFRNMSAEGLFFAEQSAAQLAVEQADALIAALNEDKP